MVNENNDNIIDAAVLDELESIMEDEFADVLQVYLEESVSLMSDIHTGFDGNSENLIRTVHTLKSCSKNVGAMSLGGVAEIMEECLVNENEDAAKTHLDELQDLFMKSHSIIKQRVEDKLHEVA